VKKEFLHFLAEKLQPTTYKKHSRWGTLEDMGFLFVGKAFNIFTLLNILNSDSEERFQNFLLLFCLIPKMKSLITWKFVSIFSCVLQNVKLFLLRRCFCMRSCFERKWIKRFESRRYSINSNFNQSHEFVSHFLTQCIKYELAFEYKRKQKSCYYLFGSMIN
jgi:hypothetical protein